MTALTPGPWGWFGNELGFYLATPDRGRRLVMDFVRMGMRGAQPRFQIDGRMVKAGDLVEFAVGDRNVRGFANGEADRSVYHYDIIAIDHPDARLLAAAPDAHSLISTWYERLTDGRRGLTPDMGEEWIEEAGQWLARIDGEQA